MKSEENGYKVFTNFILVIIFGTLATFFKALIIEDFIEWFNIPIKLTYLQIVGALMIIGLIIMKINTKKAESQDSTDSVAQILAYIVGMTLAWGIGYIYYLLFF